MPSAEGASLTYGFDAYRAWCCGFGPSLRAFAEAQRRAWFVDGRSLSGADVYRDTADEIGLGVDAVTSTYGAPASRGKARAAFRALRRLRVTSTRRCCRTSHTVATGWAARLPRPLP